MPKPWDLVLRYLVCVLLAVLSVGVIQLAETARPIPGAVSAPAPAVPDCAGEGERTTRLALGIRVALAGALPGAAANYWVAESVPGVLRDSGTVASPSLRVRTATHPIPDPAAGRITGNSSRNVPWDARISCEVIGVTRD